MPQLFVVDCLQCVKNQTDIYVQVTLPTSCQQRAFFSIATYVTKLRIDYILRILKDSLTANGLLLVMQRLKM